MTSPQNEVIGLNSTDNSLATVDQFADSNRTDVNCTKTDTKHSGGLHQRETYNKLYITFSIFNSFSVLKYVHSNFFTFDTDDMKSTKQTSCDFFKLTFPFKDQFGC